MRRYLARRVLSTLLILLIVVVLNFLLMHLAPGDPARILTGLEQPSPETLQALRERYGLDRPLWVQLGRYLAQVGRGDLGRSIVYDQPVSQLIAERLPATLLLTVTSAVLAFVAGTLAGTFSATRYFSRADLFLSFASYVLYATPSFWLGLMLILVFASWLGWFPTSGMVDPRLAATGLARLLDILRHLILPASTLALVQVPVYYRITRSSVVSVLKEDFVTTLRATGMSESKIFRKYALKNAILPTVTIFGLHMGYVVTGAALVEIVFGWPGMGRLMLGAVFRRDYPLLMGIYLIMSACVAAMILLTDLLYAWLDPRIRYQ